MTLLIAAESTWVQWVCSHAEEQQESYSRNRLLKGSQAGDVAQWVRCLPRVHSVLDSSLRITNIKQNKNTRVHISLDLSGLFLFFYWIFYFVCISNSNNNHKKNTKRIKVKNLKFITGQWIPLSMKLKIKNKCLNIKTYCQFHLSFLFCLGGK